MLEAHSPLICHIQEWKCQKMKLFLLQWFLFYDVEKYLTPIFTEWPITIVFRF